MEWVARSCGVVGLVLVVVAMTIGCGESSTDGQQDDCSPVSCSELEVECGEHFDGCDDVIDCGSCGSDEQCVEGMCLEESQCDPLSCDDVGFECGEHTDGCGEVIDCGSCGDDHSCSDGFCLFDAPPQKEAFFTDPGDDGEENDYALEEAIKQLLEEAEPGSSVHGAMYTWSRGEMADAFIDAWDRGVSVYLLIGSEYAAVDTLKEALPEDNVYVCRRDGEPSGCHGGPINHNKFFLFSSLSDGSRDVVVQSSANLTNPQLSQNNNLVVIRDDVGLYQLFRHYWHDMRRDIDDLHYFWSAEGDTGTKAYFFPRRYADSNTGENDPVVEEFDAIDCSAGAEVHIAQSRWSWARRGVAHRTAQLAEDGCSVHVLVRQDFTTDDLLAILEGGGVEVTLYPHNHSKYFMVDGHYGGDDRKVVWTGAMNFTSPGLRSNDEALVRIEDDDIYDAYRNDWQTMKDHPGAQ